MIVARRANWRTASLWDRWAQVKAEVGFTVFEDEFYGTLTHSILSGGRTLKLSLDGPSDAVHLALERLAESCRSELSRLNEKGN